MDELTAVRELRAEAPTPDRARLADGKARLLDAADRDGRGRTRGRRTHRHRPTDWRLAAVGAAAAIALAAAVGTQVVGDGEGSRPGARPPAAVLDLGGAKEFLTEAADAVQDDPVPNPRAGQWAYEKRLEIRAQEDGPGEEKGGPRETEHWYRYADPEFEKGRSGDDHSPRESFRFLADLPSAPAQVKKQARAFYPDDPGNEGSPGNAGSPGSPGGKDPEARARHDFRALTLLAARARPAEPHGLAKVYRALATVPGVKAVQTTDALGRSAIGIYLPERGEHGTQAVTLFDPETYRYSGEGTLKRVDGRWQSYNEPGVQAVMRTGLVDEEGQRP